MARTFSYIVNTDGQLKISAYLKDMGYSSHLLTLLRMHEDSICLNGDFVHMNAMISSNDSLVIKLPEEKTNEKIEAIELPIDIIYEDEDILVVNKPPFMPIHPSIEHHNDTLANALSFYFASKNEAFVYRCMTRLDRDTSGLVLIAKNILSATILSDKVKNGKIEKEYLALAIGHTDSEGIIEAPIARKEGSLVERIVDPNGQYALTHYRTLENCEINGSLMSKLRIRLKTGRTHQIRVHMKHIGHPLLGDFMYNPDDKHMSRQALHCERMSFLHPITGKELCFIAPPPDDFYF